MAERIAEDREQRIVQLERRLRETQELARVGSWEWTIGEDDEAWRATWSPQMKRIFGRDPDAPPPSKEEMIAYVVPEDRESFRRLVERIRSRAEPFEYAYRIRTGEGETRHLQARGSVDADGTGRPARTYGTTQDITELRESQAQLERARRLEALGQLAGGIAHDFNNLLAVILNYAEAASGESREPATRSALGEIERAARSAAQLTRQLLVFGRRGSTRLGPVDLAAAVAETEAMLRRTIGDHIELAVAAAPGLPHVELGEGQAEQIIVNLVVNARDALPGGGTIAISLREAGPGANGTRPRVALTVTDDGVGMTKDVAAQAFDPFFTTKPRGKGTGLGLATVYGIVGRAGGSIEIDSEPGRGTSVSVFLPASEGAREDAPVDVPPQPSAAGGKTVLVVDNEKAVRTIVCQMLEKRGYRTLAAAGGREAEAALAAEPEIDLVLTDMLMPGVSGRELVNNLRRGRPRLPAIYITGYGGGDRGSPLSAWDEGVEVLQKPFTAEQLLRAVGQALAAG